ncbi:hypothetical protein IJG14_01330 [bacterium]|nr:hypothetical protein [bacterium]
MEIIIISFTIAAILLFFGWVIKWTFIIGFSIIAIIIFLIILILLAVFSPAPKKFTQAERENFIKMEEEKFIKISKNHILKIIKETNPKFDIKKKYNFDELRDLKLRLESFEINVPLLERYIKIDPNHAKLLFLEDLIKQEVNKQFKILTFGENEK